MPESCGEGEDHSLFAPPMALFFHAFLAVINFKFSLFLLPPDSLEAWQAEIRYVIHAPSLAGSSSLALQAGVTSRSAVKDVEELRGILSVIDPALPPEIHG